VIKKRARQARQKRGILICRVCRAGGKKSQNALDSAANWGYDALHRPQLPRLPRYVMRTGLGGLVWSKGDFYIAFFIANKSTI